MSNSVKRRHAEALDRFSKETEQRAQLRPNDWLLAAAARNQRAAYQEALRAVSLDEAEDARHIFEWRLGGARVENGELPLSLLARLSDPLNRLILRATYFVRNKQDPEGGSVGQDLTNELGLKLVALEPGSARLFIRGNAITDMTGQSALAEGMANVFEALDAGQKDFAQFYERLGDLGERATESLRETLKAIEMEQCSLSTRWWVNDELKEFKAGLAQVTHLRVLLENSEPADEREEQVSGIVAMLSTSGRLQLIDGTGRRVSIRFKPKSQAEFVARLRLNQHVTLSVVAKVFVDPVSGEEAKRFSLADPDALELGTNSDMPALPPS